MRKFEKYEDVAKYLLNRFKKEFALSEVQSKQKIEGLRTGTKWEIDAKGVSLNQEGIIIIECKRYKNSRQNQEKLGALSYICP